MKTTMLKLAAVVILSAILFSSCNKDEREDLKQSAADHALAEASFNDMMQQSDNSYDNANESTKGTLDGTCPSISLYRTDSTNADTMVIDFGTGCTDSRGITRSGAIIVTYTGRYRNAGTVITIRPDNYYRNGNKIEGTKTVTNVGLDNNGYMVYNIQVTNASVTTSEGTISWNSTRTRKWIQGYNTTWPIWTDDIYLISGTASGTNINGNTFDVTITQDLRIELSCRHIVSGIVEVTPQDGDTRTLDYGDGACDNEATLTVKNKTYNITLR